MKKWFCLLLALGFSFTNVYAADDDEDWEEWEEDEEEAPKKKPKKAKKAKSDSESKIGLSVSFGGSVNFGGNDNDVASLVYNMGDLELGLGIGIDRYTDVNGEGYQNFILVPSLNYSLGKGLLDYGLGVNVRLYKEEEVMPITGFPYFYVSAELIKNVSLNLSAGIRVHKREDDMWINFATRGGITFYFL